MGKPKEPRGNERGRHHNYSRSRSTKSRSQSSELALHNFPAERVSRSAPPYPLIAKYSDHSHRAYKNHTLPKRGFSNPYGKSHQLTYRRNLTKGTLRKHFMQSQTEQRPNIGMEVQEGNSQIVNSTSAEGESVHVEGTSNGNQKSRVSQRLLKDEKVDDKTSSKEDSENTIHKQSTSTEETNGTKCKVSKSHSKTEVQKTNESVSSETENISTKTRASTRLKQESVKETGDANGSADNIDIPENEESPHTRTSRSASKVLRENKAEDTSHESQSSSVAGQSEKVNKLKNEKTSTKNTKKDQKDASDESNSTQLVTEKRETPIRNVPEVSPVKTGNDSDMTESHSTKNIATEKSSVARKLPKVTVHTEKCVPEVSSDSSQNLSVDAEMSHGTPKDTKRKSKRLAHPDKSSLDVSDDGPDNSNAESENVHETTKDIKRKSKRPVHAKDEKEVSPGKSDTSPLGSTSSIGKYSSPRIISSRKPIRESFTKERSTPRTIKKSEDRDTGLVGIESGPISRKEESLSCKQDDSIEEKRQSLKRKSDAEFSASNKKSRPARGLDSSSFFSIMSSPLQMLSQKEDPVSNNPSKIEECENPCDIKMADIEEDLENKCDVSSPQIVEQKDKKWCLLM